MSYAETVPDPVLATYARVPLRLTTSQHAADWPLPTSLIGCNPPSSSTRYDVAALALGAPPAASETMRSPCRVKSNPNGVAPVEAVVCSSTSRSCDTSKVSMVLLTFSATTACLPSGANPTCTGAAAPGESAAVAPLIGLSDCPLSASPATALLPAFSTSTRRPYAATLIGSVPPDGAAAIHVNAPLSSTR